MFMKIIGFLTLYCCHIVQLSAQEKPVYRLFDEKGTATDYRQLLKKSLAADIVLFGELHDNPIVHWLQWQLLQDIYEQDSALVLGMEMLEADNQLILDEYLDDVIEERHFLQEVKIWDNYASDYSRLVNFAKSNGLAVVASNVPRRYANLVYRQGMEALDSLHEASKSSIAPLPVEVDLSLPGYADMISMMGGHGASAQAKNIALAQALKDATMAHFILKNHESRTLHLNGSYHSKNREGVVWYLQQENPSLKVMTIHSVEQQALTELSEEHLNSADFILVVADDLVHRK